LHQCQGTVKICRAMPINGWKRDKQCLSILRVLWTLYAFICLWCRTHL